MPISIEFNSSFLIAIVTSAMYEIATEHYDDLQVINKIITR